MNIAINNTAVYGYTLNDRSQRTVTTLPDGSYWQYAYDEAGQLTGAVKYNSSGEAVGSYSYEYDGVGNRWHGHFGTGSRSRWSRQRPTAARAAYSEGDVRPHGSSADLVSYASNLINQYTAVSAAIPAYDADGNMTSYNGWTYTYNGENRLIRAEKEDYKEEYSYDYMGRRYEKKTYTKGLLSFYTWSLSEHYQFVYRGYRLAAEYRNGELLRSYAWHASSDLPAWVEMNGVKYRYVTDGNRNVRQLIGAMGAVAASYEYDGYGRLLSASGVMAEENPLRFSSEYSDTGTGLIYYNYRHYSPELGRWLRRDPIEEQGGINLYGMAGNNLVNSVDYLGLMEIFDAFPIKSSEAGYQIYMAGQPKTEPLIDLGAVREGAIKFVNMLLNNREYKRFNEYIADKKYYHCVCDTSNQKKVRTPPEKFALPRPMAISSYSSAAVLGVMGVSMSNGDITSYDNDYSNQKIKIDGYRNAIATMNNTQAMNAANFATMAANVVSNMAADPVLRAVILVQEGSCCLDIALMRYGRLETSLDYRGQSQARAIADSWYKWHNIESPFADGLKIGAGGGDDWIKDLYPLIKPKEGVRFWYELGQ